MNRYLGMVIRPSFVLMIVSILVFYLGQIQTTWAAYIICISSTCSGTSADDIIWGTMPNQVISGLGGNDIILGYVNDYSYLYGDNGNDVLIGGYSNDGLFGGLGDDKYDGRSGDDAIWDYPPNSEYFEGNDNISGNRGDDYIHAGGGADKIFGGPGDDIINSSPNFRDFERDAVDCGSGNDTTDTFYSGDGDTAIYCELVRNGDG